VTGHEFDGGIPLDKEILALRVFSAGCEKAYAVHVLRGLERGGPTIAAVTGLLKPLQPVWLRVYGGWFRGGCDVDAAAIPRSKGCDACGTPPTPLANVPASRATRRNQRGVLRRVHRGLG
jgi:hypothetical protein